MNYFGTILASISAAWFSCQNLPRGFLVPTPGWPVMPIYFEELWSFASACCRKANEVATSLRLSNNQLQLKEAEEAELLGDLPRFADLGNGYGLTGWAAILSVDLRGSSDRALKLGAGPTYVAMHTYLPAMARLVNAVDAVVVGLRGDGLFAAFGFEEISDK